MIVRTVDCEESMQRDAKSHFSILMSWSLRITRTILICFLQAPQYNLNVWIPVTSSQTVELPYVEDFDGINLHVTIPRHTFVRTHVDILSTGHVMTVVRVLITVFVPWDRTVTTVVRVGVRMVFERACRSMA